MRGKRAALYRAGIERADSHAAMAHEAGRSSLPPKEAWGLLKAWIAHDLDVDPLPNSRYTTRALQRRMQYHVDKSRQAKGSDA